jgi:hypothetical protein
MPLDAAVLKLQQMQMKCSGTNVVTCDRLRQRFASVELHRTSSSGGGADKSGVAVVKVDPITCAGL